MPETPLREPAVIATPRDAWLCGDGVAVLTDDEAATVLVLEQVLNRLCLALANGPAEDLADLFLPEGLLVTDAQRLDQEIRGREAIRAWHAETLGRRTGQTRLGAIVPITRQEGDEAEILAYSTAEQVPALGGPLEVTMGRLELRLRRTAGGWGILCLTDLRFFAYTPGTGEAPAEDAV